MKNLKLLRNIEHSVKNPKITNFVRQLHYLYKSISTINISSKFDFIWVVSFIYIAK